MKIRSDFVTNSSSSSFILAFHDGFKREEIAQEVEKYRTEIRTMLKDCAEDGNFDDKHIKVAIQRDDLDRATDLAINEIINKFMYYYKSNGLRLDSWNVFSEIYANDMDSTFFGNFMFDYGHEIETEHFKQDTFAL